MSQRQTDAKSGFVTVCQQMLVLGVVLAALVPATNVISLDIVRDHPSSPIAATRSTGTLAAYVREARATSAVPTAPVDPTVREVALTPAVAGTRAGRSAGRFAAGSLGRVAVHASQVTKKTAAGLARVVTSAPETVTGYGAVGVTWEHGENIAEDALGFKVRTRTRGTWSKWIRLDYHDDHGPDAGTAEARHERPGTDPLLVGKVDDVQVRATVAPGTAVPDDMALAVIDPGKATSTTSERAALDTATIDGDDGSDSAETPVDADADAGTGADSDAGAGADALTPTAAVFTPKPVIYSRAQWGADESMRQKSSLHYGEVHAGFVHHTATANNYSRSEVPGIIRSIYAYHTKSRGWSDIGYNYLVDRFGRIWEGRYGGIDRPVVGAHTLNYNDYSFGASAIGNYEQVQPTSAMIQAYAALFAWKLSLHGVDASSTQQWVGSKYFQAINGHRDAGQTACPGKYLYAKLPTIRELAAQTQRGWAGRDLESNLAGTPNPDLVVRRASDDELFVIPTGGLSRFRGAGTISTGWSDYQRVQVSPDLTGDGVPDLIAVAADGTVELHPGDGHGGFATTSQTLSGLSGLSLVTAVGDVDDDGLNDLAGRDGDGHLVLFRGRAAKFDDGQASFKRRVLGGSFAGITQLASAGDLDGDGRDDLAMIDSAGSLTWRRSIVWKNRAGFSGAKELTGLTGTWTAIAGGGDFNGDGDADLVVRAENGSGYLLPGRGDGSVGLPIGPYGPLAKATRFGSAADVAGDSSLDLVALIGDRLVRFVNAGTFDLARPIDTGVAAPDANAVLNAGDWDRDGYGDVIVRTKAGNLYLRRGDGTGHLGAATKIGTGFKGVKLLAAVGDMTGDGWPDLMGQPKNGSMRIYPGRGMDGIGSSYVAHSEISAGRQIAVGRWDGDGAPDSLFRKGNSVTLYPGNGPGGLTNPKKTGLDLSPYDWAVGISGPRLTDHPGLLVRRKGTGNLYLIPGTSSGFGKPRFLGEGMEAYDLAG